MITIRSPAAAMPWRSAMRLDLLDHFLEVRTSRVWTACAPHSSPFRRATSEAAVIARSGTGGRSRAIRRAVDPLVV